MNTVTAYVALGSNLDNPIKQVTNAFEALAEIADTQLLARSKLYKSSPMGPADQPDFINAVAALSTNLSALELLRALQSIEEQHGRQRTLHWGPRTLDLDLLLYSNQVINSPSLTLPHPGLPERDFVLYPLAEIAPQLILPCGKTLTDLLQNTSQDCTAFIA
jgi:2-amino-4-hydroxy-6-hydroxymethyldihydropteridine diphosphokinase